MDITERSCIRSGIRPVGTNPWKLGTAAALGAIVPPESRSDVPKPGLLPTQLCCILCNVAERVDLAGAAHLVLVPGVRHLDPESAVFEAMLEGWALQQRTRFLKAETISSRLRLARRVTSVYPGS